ERVTDQVADSGHDTRWVSGYLFFFQAEDGIRDLIVTGVQTCALPIWSRAGSPPAPDAVRVRLAQGVKRRYTGDQRGEPWLKRRQIGRASCREECRSRWWPYR